jgi:hypothetical protein
VLYDPAQWAGKASPTRGSIERPAPKFREFVMLLMQAMPRVRMSTVLIVRRTQSKAWRIQSIYDKQ